MSAWDFDAVVVGGGAVGLAVAAALSQRGAAVLVLEAGDRPGEGTSARNSQVIHSGLYYPTGSLKHRFCVAGRRMLYAFLDKTGVAYRKCGKLIVSTDAAEDEKLAAILKLGRENGVEELTLLSGAEVSSREPEVAARAAIHSAETGIFDSHAYLLALLAIVEDGGGVLACRTPFIGAERRGAGFAVRTGGADPATVQTRLLVNAGGLSAPSVASAIADLPPGAVPEQWLAKGNYFRLTGRSPFAHLIYPVPVDGGLGVHATLDLGGATRFGPDVDWLPEGTDPKQIDYSVSPARAGAFEAAIRRYWPRLPAGALAPDYSGVRPKLRAPGAGFFDFVLQTEAAHKVPGLVNLFGIESPGLTASLAIGEAAADVFEDP